MLIDILNVIQPNINVHTSKMEGNVPTKRGMQDPWCFYIWKSFSPVKQQTACHHGKFQDSLFFVDRLQHNKNFLAA